MGKIRTALGLMSGTSMDGIDLAVIQTDGHDHLARGQLPDGAFPFGFEFREQLQETLETAKTIAQRSERPALVKQVEDKITRLHAEFVNDYLSENSGVPPSIDVIGFHGQTVLHRPEKGLTVQLGDGQLLADLTGIPVVYDMRANDMEHGGQGAPLVPVYHQLLSRNLEFSDNRHVEASNAGPIAFVNIGGISNITYVGDELIAFDAGPGNALIDQWVEKHVGIGFDQGGMIAAEGKIDRKLVQSYLDDPFFSQTVPKSLDRLDFRLPNDPTIAVETGARSLARVTAEAIFRAVEHLPRPPGLWIVSGGGAYNPHIMDDLKELAEQQNSMVVSANMGGVSQDMMEAEAWAYLAVRSLERLPLTFPRTTGCKKPVTGGVLAIPRGKPRLR